VTKQYLTVERLREVLDYDPETGVFTWKTKNAMRIAIGDVAGHSTYGRKKVCVFSKVYHQSRLAWFYVFGEWPRYFIDHIDGDPLNNAFSNLRDVPQSINLQNQKRCRSSSKTGFLGVETHRTKFHARICVNGRRISLGTFKTAEEAHQVYLRAKRDLHVGCTI
jgi:hypothetical protein